MGISERDLEELIHDAPYSLPPLYNTGAHSVVRVDGWLWRQLGLPSGRLDLLGVAHYSGYMSLVVVELKKGAINSKALTQVSRYAADIENVLGEIADHEGVLSTQDATVFKVVVGDSIDVLTLQAARGMGITTFVYRERPTGITIEPVYLDDQDYWLKYRALAQRPIFTPWNIRARREIEMLRWRIEYADGFGEEE